MSRVPIAIGRKEFRIQEDALAYFSEMLSKYRNNQVINDDEDHAILLSLIECHPGADKKIGVGVRLFYKALTDMGTSCFWIERDDGSKTRFSYKAGVKAKDKSLYQEFSDACRESVREDLVEIKKHFFRNNSDDNGEIECEITGENIAIYESHLDHKKPLTFQVIVNTFITANEIVISKDMLSSPQDTQFTTNFVDQELKNRFRKYHHQIAQLRIINPKANRSLGGSERITKSKRPVVIPSKFIDN